VVMARSMDGPMVRWSWAAGGEMVGNRVVCFHYASTVRVRGSKVCGIGKFSNNFSGLLARSERFELPTLRFEV
jgi:hypothetical protein